LRPLALERFCSAFLGLKVLSLSRHFPFLFYSTMARHFFDELPILLAKYWIKYYSTTLEIWISCPHPSQSFENYESPYIYPYRTPFVRISCTYSVESVNCTLYIMTNEVPEDKHIPVALLSGKMVLLRYPRVTWS
jgi:hypothetical protein